MDDLKEIGIELLGHRIRIMKEIAKLNNVQRNAAQNEGNTAYI